MWMSGIWIQALVLCKLSAVPSPSPGGTVNLSRRRGQGKIGLRFFESLAFNGLCGDQGVAMDS